MTGGHKGREPRRCSVPGISARSNYVYLVKACYDKEKVPGGGRADLHRTPVLPEVASSGSGLGPKI